MTWSYVPGRVVNIGIAVNDVNYLENTDTPYVSKLAQEKGNKGTQVIMHVRQTYFGFNRRYLKWQCKHFLIRAILPINRRREYKTFGKSGNLIMTRMYLDV